MNKLLLILFFFVSADETPAFDALVAQFQDGLILQAEMEHLFRDSFTGEETYNTGSVLIGSDSYFISVDDQIVYVDGYISRVYNSRENKVIISTYNPDDDDFAPSRFFGQQAQAYTIYEEPGEGGQTIINLTTNDPFEIFQDVTITLGSNGLPLEVYAVDQTENIFITAFNSASFIEETDQTFSFSYPENADIIDLRE